MKIDVHNHAIPQEVLDLLSRDSSYGVTFPGGVMRCGDGFEFPLVDSFYDPKAKLTELERCDLDGAVLSIAPPAFLYDVPPEKTADVCVATNEGLAKLVQNAPDRLRWLAHVPMHDVDRAVMMLRRARAAGAVGVEIATNVGGLRPDEPIFEPFWAALDELGLLVMLHPYYNGSYAGMRDWYLQNVVGNPLETMIVGCRLICSGILDRFPNVSVLLVHGGGHLPYQLGRLNHAIAVREELAKAPKDAWHYARKIKFDSLTHDAEALGYLIGRLGAENVFVGTDLPFDMAGRTPIATLEAAVGPAVAARIAKDNPAALFSLS